MFEYARKTNGDGEDVEEDLAHLMKAAAKKWEGAILTRSGIVLALAKIGTDGVLKKPNS